MRDGFSVLAALIVTGPGASPVTRPEGLTDATSGLPVDHVTPCEASAGRTTTWSWIVPPRSSELAGAETITDCTSGGAVLKLSQPAIARDAMRRASAGARTTRAAMDLGSIGQPPSRDS
jgi:hypothetical protein